MIYMCIVGSTKHYVGYPGLILYTAGSNAAVILILVILFYCRNNICIGNFVSIWYEEKNK